MKNYDFIPSNVNGDAEKQVELVCKTILANMSTNIYDGRNHYAPKVGVCQTEDGRLYWGRDNVLFYPTEQVLKKALAAFKEKGYYPYYDNDVCYYRVAKDKNEVNLNTMKYSFKTHWIHNEEKFQAQLLHNGKVIEEMTFDYLSEMFEYIEEAMCYLQIAGEDWTFTY